MARIMFVTILSVFVSTLYGQEPPDHSAAERPQISDGPFTVDPSELVPEFLSRSMTLDMPDSSLLELATTLEQELKTPVLFDTAALQAAGIPLAEPFRDRLANGPAYLLLNRLSVLGLAWYVDDNVIHITTAEIARQQMRTNSYPIGDLVDGGFESESLRRALAETLLTGTETGESGSVQLLGDVLFVRHNHLVHRQVRGLLSALRKHGRQTFIMDPPEHQPLRKQLDVNVSAQFNSVPLSTTVTKLADLTGLDIRIDSAALRAGNVREREPVSLTLSDRPLRTVLTAMLGQLKLTWTLRDAVIWVTTPAARKAERVIAVYDVGDLCRNTKETYALMNAIPDQTSGEWHKSKKETGHGRVISPGAGCIIVRHTQKTHRELEQLLQAYRIALANSKQRNVSESGSEIVTRFHRLQTPLAEALHRRLAQLIPGWNSDSKTDLISAGKGVTSELNDDGDSIPFELEMSVLIVTQERRIQRELTDIIERLTEGDFLLEIDKEDEYLGGGGGGGGFGGGGGQGFFSLQDHAHDTN